MKPSQINVRKKETEESVRAEETLSHEHVRDDTTKDRITLYYLSPLTGKTYQLTDNGDKFLTNVLLFCYNRIYTKQNFSFVQYNAVIVLRVIN